MRPLVGYALAVFVVGCSSGCATESARAPAAATGGCRDQATGQPSCVETTSTAGGGGTATATRSSDPSEVGHKDEMPRERTTARHEPSPRPMPGPVTRPVRPGPGVR